MRDKLETIERRTKILEFLITNKETTRKELSIRFKVCSNTIINDLYSIGRIAPIYTKPGKGGGVYILPGYQSSKNYLTEAEENCLYRTIQVVNNEEKKIIGGIIVKFAKNPLRAYSNLLI